jgi:hypothetical protein
LKALAKQPARRRRSVGMTLVSAAWLTLSTLRRRGIRWTRPAKVTR